MATEPITIGPAPRQIRVFISSTFKDMQTERDILIKKIFPQLRKLCEERAATWTEVDLRWGITTEQASEGKVLPLCLEEIHRCRPYFIGLLGERYGWVPEPNSIPADLLESQPWLKQHLHQSVTELEILHGVFSGEPMHGHAYFYFRDPKYLESVPADKRQYFTSEGAEAAGKLAKLKQKIRGARDEQVCELREGYANPEQLGEWILEDFTNLIDRLYPKDQTPDPIDQEAARHEAYARSRRLAFVGREDLLHRLNDHCATTGKPLVLTGESGCGKSALLAEWWARWRKEHPDDIVIQHYVGSTPDSADWQGLVRRILSVLKRAFAITDEIPVQPDALRGALSDWTVKPAGSRQVVLMLDALNQLAEDGAARQLGWLPVVFPPNFRVLVSTLPGESLNALRKRDWLELEVPLFAHAEIAPATFAYFRTFSKTPPPDIVAKLESTPAACNALYLRAVLDELRQFGKREDLRIKAAEYLSAPDLPELFDRILTRWHDDFGNDPEHPDLVRCSLCLIACARFGLSEAELLDLLGTGGEPLPRRFWTPFYLAAENALARRAGLINFGHDYLCAAVQRRYLSDEQKEQMTHMQIAAYFESSAFSIRKVNELPWQLRWARKWDELTNALTDVALYPYVMANQMEYEWIEHWQSLRGRSDPTVCYEAAIERVWKIEGESRTVASLLNHASRLLELLGLYSGALTYRERAFRILENNAVPNDPVLAPDIDNLASLHLAVGNIKKADELSQHALDAQQNPPDSEGAERAIYLGNRAMHLEQQGSPAEALPVAEQALRILKLVKGPDHSDVAIMLSNLSTIHFDLENLGEALRLQLRALEIEEHLKGPSHTDVGRCLHNLAFIYMAREEFAVAFACFSRSLAILEKALGHEHPDVAAVLSGIGLCHVSQGDYENARGFLEKALSMKRKLKGESHPDVAYTLYSLAGALAMLDEFRGAMEYCGRAVAIAQEVFGNQHPKTLMYRERLRAIEQCVVS